MEMVLWDAWGIMEAGGAPTPAEHSLLDDVAAAIIRQESAEVIQNLYGWDEFRVPDVVTSHSAASDVPLQVRIDRHSPGVVAS